MQELFARSRHLHAAKLGLNPLRQCKSPGLGAAAPKALGAQDGDGARGAGVALGSAVQQARPQPL